MNRASKRWVQADRKLSDFPLKMRYGDSDLVEIERDFVVKVLAQEVDERLPAGTGGVLLTWLEAASVDGWESVDSCAERKAEESEAHVG